MDSNITFIGAGNMASSIVGGLISNGSDPGSITVTDLQRAQLDKVRTAFNVNTSDDNKASVRDAKIVVLAVKPDIVSRVCKEISAELDTGSLVISIAAGIRECDISRWLGNESPIIRCMPNTPALLSCGASALFSNTHCTSAHRELAENLMSAVGITVWVEQEEQIDAVTALSGSGPAYFFQLIECMTESAIALGIPLATAETLAIETAYGAAKMARQRNVTPAILRQNVTSKGGTTAAALASFEQDNFSETVHRAMQAARQRAESLADELGDEPTNPVV